MLSFLASMSLLVVIMLGYHVLSGYAFSRKTKRWQRELGLNETLDRAARTGNPLTPVK